MFYGECTSNTIEYHQGQYQSANFYMRAVFLRSIYWKYRSMPMASPKMSRKKASSTSAVGCLGAQFCQCRCYSSWQKRFLKALNSFCIVFFSLFCSFLRVWIRPLAFRSYYLLFLLMLSVQGFYLTRSVILLPWSSLLALLRISVKMSWLEASETRFLSDLLEGMDSLRVLLRLFSKYSQQKERLVSGERWDLRLRPRWKGSTLMSHLERLEWNDAYSPCLTLPIDFHIAQIYLIKLKMQPF